MSALTGKRVLLVIGGGIAAYKALELIRRLKEDGASVRAILSEGGAKFITALSVAALSGNAVYSDLFSLKDETEMGHIRLSREADVVVVAP
ncbi:MAG TPA: flavoprotein, partial [Sphingomonadales bacterium]|nr:flavoprotein [Sphingomonadales bacterium]